MSPGNIVFVCPWGDFFHPAADSWRNEAWNIISERKDLIFIIITKRIERTNKVLPKNWFSDGVAVGYSNVWLGITAENQDRLNARLPYLLSARQRVAIVSHEPALGPILYPRSFLEIGEHAWVIAGGETGFEATRPSSPDWFRNDRDQCQMAGIPFWFKQWGAWISGEKLSGGFYLQDGSFLHKSLVNTSLSNVKKWSDSEFSFRLQLRSTKWQGNSDFLDGVAHKERPKTEGLCTQQQSLCLY
jgi:protein gp37